MTRAHVAFALLACALAGGAARAEAYDELLAAARQEGEVNVHGGPGHAFTESFSEGFRRRYPDIKMNYTGAPASTANARILRERENGVFAWDAFIGGAPSAFPTLKAGGAFAPLKPALLRETIDDTLWLNGFDDGWLDHDRKFMFGFDFTTDAIVWVNRDILPRDKFNDLADLTKPEFRGKISWSDPRSLGEGSAGAQVIYVNFGEQFLIDLYTRQDVVFTQTRRQTSEWLVRGRYPIAIGASPDDLATFQAEGLGKNVEPMTRGLKQQQGGPGYGSLQIMDRPPHPAAARLYANWLLSRDAQAAYAKLSVRNSRRLDAPPGKPDDIAQPGVAYLNVQSEDAAATRTLVQKLANEKIGAGAR